jgi:hypothetical protein
MDEAALVAAAVVTKDARTYSAGVETSARTAQRLESFQYLTAGQFLDMHSG